MLLAKTFIHQMLLLLKELFNNIYLCMWAFCLLGILQHVHAWCSRRLKEDVGSPGTEWDGCEQPMGSGNWTCVFWKGSQCFQLLLHLSRPPVVLFCLATTISASISNVSHGKLLGFPEVDWRVCGVLPCQSFSAPSTPWNPLWLVLCVILPSTNDSTEHQSEYCPRYIFIDVV